MLLATMLAVSAVQGSWRLVWRDEFDRAGRPDPLKWTYEKGFVRNNEAQFYTDDRRENARIENGRLIVEARKDNFGGHPVSSASLTTQGLASWTYGRIEVRAKIPTGKGTWPAIWMLGDNISKIGWPKCGEIDILENVGYDPDKAVFTVHSTKKDGTDHGAWGESITSPGLSKEYHLYGLEWTPAGMTWLFDGKPVHTYTKSDPHDVAWVFDKPQYLILNLAIGGAWGGQQGIDQSIYPSRFEVDYVRVYQKG
jgi:beta-glucanase (GH16 family)